MNQDSESVHRGVMVCKCSFAMVDQTWPLQKNVNHLNSRCKWTCCDEPWCNDKCMSITKPIRSPRDLLQAPVQKKNMGADDGKMLRNYYDPVVLGDDEQYNTRAIAASQGTRGIFIDENQQYSDYEMANEEVEEDEYGSWNNNFSNPLCFLVGGTTEVNDEDAWKSRLLTATMNDVDFRKLVKQNVMFYLKLLNLSVNQSRNIDMVNSWVLSGCGVWIRVAGGYDIASVQLIPVMYDFLSEFTREANVYPQEESLKKAAGNL